MMKRGPIKSDIAWSTANRITVRGRDLPAELIGEINLGDMAFLTLTNRLPNAKESRLFNAIAITLVEHGVTPSVIAARMTYLGAPANGFLLIYILIVLGLGCIIDSVSIMLIMLPIVLPIAKAFGMDLIWFGVVTVVAIEIGLITPPFGISVFTVKAAVNDPRISTWTVFAGACPFVVCMAAVLVILVLFPVLSTYLAR
jgi:TRAP-type C4-dicarboxylate transport system permease large subunit